jgi:hypothetical protein
MVKGKVEVKVDDNDKVKDKLNKECKKIQVK